MRTSRLDAPEQYRLDLFDTRVRKGDLALVETLSHQGGHARTRHVPAGEGYPLGDSRVRATLHFPVDLTRLELSEAFRWIGSLDTEAEIDRIFEEWETRRMHHAGVRVDVVEGTAAAYRLDDLALCGPAMKKEGMETQEPRTEPKIERRRWGRPVLPEGAIPRTRTLANSRRRYDVIPKGDHAELVFYRAHGRGEVRAVARVDLEDVDLVTQYAWHVSGSEATGLRVETDTGPTAGSRIRLQLHRVLVPTPSDVEVGFRNGDPLDLRKANLAPNLKARRPKKGSRSGVRGVSWNGSSGKWEATVGDRKLGLHATVAEAEKVVRAERARIGWGEREAAR